MELLHQLTGANEVALAILEISIISVLGLALSVLKIHKVGLGITGVLFAGIFFGHLGWQINEEILKFVREFGLILFVFTIGLQIGPGFFASLKKQGLSLNLCAAAIVFGGAVVALLSGRIFGLNPLAVAGLFSGATTNTPSLAAAQEAIALLPHADPATKVFPALAYAVAYPGGVFGIILAIILLRVLFKIEPEREVAAFEELRQSLTPPLTRRSITITKPEFEGVTISLLPGIQHSGIIVSRIRGCAEGAEVQVASRKTVVHLGDIILAVGALDALNALEAGVGEQSEIDLIDTTSRIFNRKLVVTRQEELGKSLKQLALHTIYGVVVTRIQRSEVEMRPDPNMHLQFGDALQVVGSKQGLDQVEELLGNSPKELSHTNFLPVFVGIGLGVIAGLLPITLPGLPAALKLGLAGGPLVIAIILSRIGHIGRVVWYMPTGANLALRELGIVLFLACVGLKAGSQFIPTLMSPQGLHWLAAGFCITVIPLMVVGIIARTLMKMNFVTLCGLISGSMTDPPALAFATTLVKSDSVSLSYATVYPLTMLLRILCAQLLILLF
jgi:putative transport protein